MKSQLALALVTILLMGCTLLKLHQDRPVEEDPEIKSIRYHNLHDQ